MTDSPGRVTLDWVADAVGSEHVRALQELSGGTHARTHLLVTADGREVVLRRFPLGDQAVRRERVVLEALDGLGGLAPRLVAADPDGTCLGAPTILTTRLAGRPWLTPADPHEFARQLGVVLARIHSHPPPPGARDVLRAPAESSAPFVAEVLADWSRLSQSPRVLSHFDYWSGNTLWSGDRLSGVVDWSGAGLAPRGFDLSWCRLDLILLFDEDVANALTSGYEATSQQAVSDAVSWDLFAAVNAFSDIEGWAPNYQSLGRTDLGPRRLRAQLSQWVHRLRARAY